MADQATREEVVFALGNVSGVAAVEDAIKPWQAAPDPDKIYPAKRSASRPRLSARRRAPRGSRAK